jgi:hypothetical protein
MKTHIFNRRRFRIVLESVDGLCDIPQTKEYDLFIFADLRTKNGLVTAIHEALHAEDKDMKESEVDRISKEIGSFLWRLGYRLRRNK